MLTLSLAALLLQVSPPPGVASDAVAQDASPERGTLVWPASSAFSASLIGGGLGLTVGSAVLGNLPNRMQSNMTPAALIGFTTVGVVGSALAGWALGSWAREGSSGAKALVWIMHCAVMTAVTVGVMVLFAANSFRTGAPLASTTPQGP